jgi:ribosomal protein L40E
LEEKDVTRRSLGFVQLEWICPSCSTPNPGPKKTCIKCGAPQPPDVQFQRAVDEQLAAKPDDIDAAAAGADYICPYCGTRNSARAKVCVQCGGDLVEARRRAAGAELEANTGPRRVTCTNCGTQNPVSRANCSKCGSPLPRPAAPGPTVTQSVPATAGRKSQALIWAAIAAAVALCAAILWLFVFPSSTMGATVSDVRWQTSVPVQAVRAVQHSDEAGSAPAGAYDVSCHTESRQVCEERVIDQGNGFGEKVQDCHDESQEYCSYTVDEWQTIQTYTLDGNDPAPVFARPSITAGQRLGDQSADYAVIFITDKGPKTYSPSDLNDFSRFRIGSTWTLNLNALGGILTVRP